MKQRKIANNVITIPEQEARTRNFLPGRSYFLVGDEKIYADKLIVARNHPWQDYQFQVPPGASVFIFAAAWSGSNGPCLYEETLG